ncbi:cysteine--tRNA ligase [Candidatus Curtissbacteria bacterium]|nr:cysteine--tRNA ligase [Candidatus Curtissbacteria bacterium]
MKLYNSLSEKKESLNDKKIGIYVCGITPYDTTHLGHAFTFLIYDVLVRYLRFLGRDVTYVQNVTDIDDDILIKAKSLGISWQTLGKNETQRHLKNMRTLGALRPDFYPKATEHISSMIQIIELLLRNGLAYKKNGSVYFDVKSDKKFGKLSKLPYRAMLTIANDRGNFPLDPKKRDPLDFVLWQDGKVGEPTWDSPWGHGRPGWHIECSAMSMRYLGPTLTIHGGGEDLIFPHHEAEIAQSENYSGKKFAKFWMYTGMVYCEGKKMSKSLGNMIFIDDLLKKYSASTIRIYLLWHHYRSSWNYREEDLKNAKKIAVILEASGNSRRPIRSKTQETLSLRSRMSCGEVKKTLPDFFAAMDDDLNIGKAIKILIDYVKLKNANAAVVAKCGKILGLIL